MQNEHRLGQTYSLIATAIEGLYPVLAHAAVAILPPLWFAGVCQVLSSLIHGGILLVRSPRRIPLTPRMCLDIVGVVLCIVVLPACFIMLGTKLSSGINTGLIMPLEVPYTALISWLLFRESLTPKAILGIILSFCGMLALVIGIGGIRGGLGEMLIVLAILMLPFGNRLAKKTLHVLRGGELLFLRSLGGGVILLLLSGYFEHWPVFPLPPTAISLILGYSVVVLVVGKLFWYAGLKRLRVVDAVSLVAAAPAFSLIFAMVLLGERPNIGQGIGFLLIILGLFLITHPKKLTEIYNR